MQTKRFFTAFVMVLAMAYQPMLAQSTAPEAEPDAISIISDFEQEGCSILEVSKEMFGILAQDERAAEEVKEALSQINHLVYLDCFDLSHQDRAKSEEFDLTKEFREKATDFGFRLLMRSQSSQTSSLFYKREKGDDNEYLLVTKGTIQYISTPLTIMSIRALKDIMEMAGDAGDL